MSQKNPAKCLISPDMKLQNIFPVRNFLLIDTIKINELPVNIDNSVTVAGQFPYKFSKFLFHICRFILTFNRNNGIKNNILPVRSINYPEIMYCNIRIISFIFLTRIDLSLLTFSSLTAIGSICIMVSQPSSFLICLSHLSMTS